MKILIADDNQENCLLLQRYLEHYGECDIVVNGLEVVDAVSIAHQQNEPYDLICLDIMMPEMDGQQALQVVREMENKLVPPPEKAAVIFMITALNDSKEIIAAFDHGGCDAYLTKPLSHAILTRKLREHGFYPLPDKDS
ncbi:MAG: response regulator transcription factor [Magnetococcales bacterium]|nr:response regulator transcription factor [Magnetococcales bacterium]